jgi:hypothetical protein
MHLSNRPNYSMYTCKDGPQIYQKPIANIDIWILQVTMLSKVAKMMPTLENK